MTLRTRWAAVAAGAVGMGIAVFAPSIIASHYSDGPGGTPDVLGHPVRGWQFAVDAVRSSRGARLGSHQSALEVARDQVWTGSSGRAVDVELVWTRAPFTVPVPPGEPDIPLARRTVRPASPFSWIVEGRVRRGPRRVIGVLDHASGRVMWDVRSRTPGVRR